jgi:asparaginyl-tRNA synthetase
LPFPFTTISIAEPVPLAGEVCGGSMRESDADVLVRRLTAGGVAVPPQLDWYVQLRRLAAYPDTMGGFGIGFDRLLQTLLGIESVKDTIPFPRYYQHCDM